MDFSEKSLDAYQKLVKELKEESGFQFSEQGEYDFTRCLRPNGSAYGTRGNCQAPNKVAPKQDVPNNPTSKQQFIAGGGMAALRQGMSTEQVINRGSKNRSEAFKAGGGTAAVKKQGLTPQEVINQGLRNRSEAIKAAGGLTGKSPNELISLGVKNRAAAYKAGGGDAAARSGKRTEDIIKDGAENLKKAYLAGGGKAATSPNMQIKDVVSRGKKALDEASAAGGGSVKRGLEILKNPLAESKLSSYEAGGGDKKLKEAVDAESKKLKRSLNKREVEKLKEAVSSQGERNLNKLLEDGGGKTALTKNKTVDEVISTGVSNRRAAYEAGGGDAAKKAGLSDSEIRRRGKLANDRAVAIGKGDAKEGKEILKNPMSGSKLSSYEAGGGDKKLKEAVDAESKKLKRSLTKEEISALKGRVEKWGDRQKKLAFEAGGGVSALTSDVTVDDVIRMGKKALR